MAATWADIQKLAADLQRAQLAQGADRFVFHFYYQIHISI